MILTILFGLFSAPAQAGEQTQTVLFFAKDSPLVVEFELKVAGQPFAQVWQEGLREIVKELDKDGDGFLSREETDGPKPSEQPGKDQPAIAEKKPVKRTMPVPLALLQTPNLWEADAEPKDGRLSLEELAWFLARQGQGPLQAQANKQSGAMQSPQVTVVSSAGQRLWDWLDENKDGKLSREELHNAANSLRKYDLDGDETISLNEIEGVQNPFFSARQSNQSTETPFFVVMRQQSVTPIIRQMLLKYGKAEAEEAEEADQAKKPKGVRLETLAIPKTEAAAFDRDGNGVLDELELWSYLKSPVPMVRITVELPADGKGDAEISGQVLAEDQSFLVKKSGVGAVSILAGEDLIEIDANGLRPDLLMQSLKERFRRIDLDNNGYLEQNEANRDNLFRNHFKAYDADGDGKLYPEEWEPAVSNRLKLAATGTRMTVEDAGQDVFTVLDSDRNLKISPREWLTASDRMAVWDEDNNGTLEKSEVPHVYRVSFGPGLPDLPGLILPQNEGGLTPSAQQLVKGPKWFQAMDKNGDGDVSPKEFLGTRELFEQLDQDKNSLIDSREASRFAE